MALVFRRTAGKSGVSFRFTCPVVILQGVDDCDSFPICMPIMPHDSRVRVHFLDDFPDEFRKDLDFVASRNIGETHHVSFPRGCDGDMTLPARHRLNRQWWELLLLRRRDRIARFPGSDATMEFGECLPEKHTPVTRRDREPGGRTSRSMCVVCQKKTTHVCCIEKCKVSVCARAPCVRHHRNRTAALLQHRVNSQHTRLLALGALGAHPIWYSNLDLGRTGGNLGLALLRAEAAVARETAAVGLVAETKEAQETFLCGQHVFRVSLKSDVDWDEGTMLE